MEQAWCVRDTAESSEGECKDDRNVTVRVMALPRHTHSGFHRNSENKLLVTFIPKHGTGYTYKLMV